MQVTPALPWAEETEGGVIQLANPLSFQELLDGELIFVLNDNGNLIFGVCDEGSSGLVVKDPTSYTVIYQIERYEGELSELPVTKENDVSGISLNDVYLRRNAIETLPELPLEAGVGCQMCLQAATSPAAVSNGQIEITLAYNGEQKKALLTSNGSTIVNICWESAENVAYQMTIPRMNSKILTLENMMGQNGPVIVNAQLADSLPVWNEENSFVTLGNNRLGTSANVVLKMEKDGDVWNVNYCQTSDNLFYFCTDWGWLWSQMSSVDVSQWVSQITAILESKYPNLSFNVIGRGNYEISEVPYRI